MGSVWCGQPWLERTAFISALYTTYKNDWKKLQLSYPDAIHILAGDFNQNLVDWHYYGSKLILLKLEEVMKECNMTIVTAGENDPIARDSNPHACIHHICVSNSKVEKIYSTKRWPDENQPDNTLSDHFGVIVEIELKSV